MRFGAAGLHEAAAKTSFAHPTEGAAVTKCALITGVGGQDAAYLARFLLGKGYTVWGGYRRTASGQLWRLAELGLEDSLKYIPLELLELSNLQRVLERVQPTEVYNLAAQSFVGDSFETPIYTSDVNALGTLRLLEAIRQVNPKIRFYQASTSEMFGKVRETVQSETTAFHPRSPYGVSKVFAHWATVNYREAYGLHASSGILFNHESPLRGTEFVTRKITLALAKIQRGKQEVLNLGNMSAARDWGFAGDYVEGMWAMLQQDAADDYVLATGETHTVEEFVQRTADALGIELKWSGEGESQKASDARTGKVLVQVDPAFYRPAEVDTLTGNNAKAKRVLGWQPRVGFAELVSMMAKADAERLDRQG
jgi:GDPmannose 4,6-dehydratase